MLDPKLAQKLMKSKEMNDFVDFLRLEASKLNTITDLKEIPNIDLVLEVRARDLAFSKLVKILEPLLNSREERETFNKLEYTA